MSEQALGFGETTRAVAVFIGENDNGPEMWYMWNRTEGVPIWISANTLVGNVVGLYRAEASYKGKSNPKLNLVVQADRTYIIRTGLYTVVARCLASALGGMDDEQLHGLVTLELKKPKPRDGEEATNVVLLDAYDALGNGPRKFLKYPSEDGMHEAILKRLYERLPYENPFAGNDEAEAHVAETNVSQPEDELPF